MQIRLLSVTCCALWIVAQIRFRLQPLQTKLGSESIYVNTRRSFNVTDYDLSSQWRLMVVTHRRPELLFRCLRTVLACDGVERFDLAISLDAIEEYATVIAGLNDIVQEFPWLYRRVRLYVKPADHERNERAIASHVMFALDKLYEGSTKYGVLLEEDLVVSLDFIQYMIMSVKVLESDNSLFCTSAWNDNGYLPFAANESKFMRTNGFPGMGWLTTRRTANMVKGKLPFFENNWDNWFAQVVQQNQMECIVPEVPRVRHLGQGGVHISDNSVYEHMTFATRQADTSLLSHELSRLTKQMFDSDLASRIDNARKVQLAAIIDPNMFSFGHDHDYVVPIVFQRDCPSMVKHYNLFDISTCKMTHDGVLQVSIPTSHSTIYFIDQVEGQKWLQ